VITAVSSSATAATAGGSCAETAVELAEAGAIHEEVDLDDLAPGDREAGDPDQLAVAGH
jgi:hypothetical protein